MTTSGSAAYNPNVLQIITQALALIRVGAEGEPINAAMTNDALTSLNLMVKAWQADGLHLWTKEEGVLFLVTGQPAYGMGGTTADNSCLSDDLVTTALSADASTGAFTILVDSIVGIASGDHIGIQTDGYTVQWTTVNGAPSGSTVTITDALTADASEDGIVFAYTTKMVRPTRVLQARRRTLTNGGDPQTIIDVPVIIQERPDYFDQPNKFAQSTVTQIYYSPQLVTGLMYVWATDQNETDTIRFTFERPLEDFTNLVQTADFPQEWIETLSYNLAYRLAPKYSFPLNERALLRTDALEMKQKLMGFDREYGSVFIQPDYTAGGGFTSFDGR